MILFYSIHVMLNPISISASQPEPKCHIDLRFQLSHSWGRGVHQWEPKCHIDLRFTLSHSVAGVGVGLNLRSMWHFISGWCTPGYIRSHSNFLQVSNPEMKCLFLDYVQLLMISRAGRWTRIPSATPLQPKKWNAHFWITFNFWWSAEQSQQWKSTKMWQKAPKSPKNEILIFINYVQLLMIGQAIRVMKVDQMRKNDMLFQLESSVVSVRVFCCFSLGLLCTPPRWQGRN